MKERFRLKGKEWFGQKGPGVLAVDLGGRKSCPRSSLPCRWEVDFLCRTKGFKSEDVDKAVLVVVLLEADKWGKRLRRDGSTGRKIIGPERGNVSATSAGGGGILR